MALASLVAPVARAQSQTDGLRQKINHVVIIYQENWSFDSLYGKFPGANGFDQAAATTPQLDKDGNAYPTLPQPLTRHSAHPDLTFGFQPICRSRRST